MIPDVDYYRSSELIHDFNSYFNPPGLTNFIGVVQVDRDLTGIRGLNFPPFGTSQNRTCGLYINEVYFSSNNVPISYQWRPDKIKRQVNFEGIQYVAETIIVPGKVIVLVRMTMKNISGINKDLKVKLQLEGGVTSNTKDWANWIPPMESDNDLHLDQERNGIMHSSKRSSAFLMQGIKETANRVSSFGVERNVTISAGGSETITYVAAMAETSSLVQDLFDSTIAKTDSIINEAEIYWNDQIKSIFNPNSDNYSGSFPVLSTENKSLLKLYHMGIMGVIYFRRENPLSCMGRTYDTLMPRYWQTVTFIWDYYLSGTVHAILDPDVMKKYLETWMQMDVHKCFGLEYIHCNPVGPWYSINDHAMVMMIREYLRWTGDKEWLNSKPDGKNTVLDFLEGYAYQYQQFLSEGGLADYGGINNLLECVSTYIHEVASLNAANICNLRWLSELYKNLNNEAASIKADASANKLLNKINYLYVDSKGYWKARQPDGSSYEIKHCYDFFTVINTIGDALPQSQKNEMVAFFMKELKTDKWMRALSESDENAVFSTRPDHQWNGAYTAWPSQALLALFKSGYKNEALDWIEGLAHSANQGPFGQAHFSETIVDEDAGGARKSPADQPFHCDWICSSNGNWINVLFEGIFGLKPTVFNGISANPILEDVELLGLKYQGTIYDVTKDGLKSRE